MINKLLSKQATMTAVFALFAGLSVGNAFAHEVALSDESGQPGDTVTVTFTFTGDGSSEGMQAEAIISNPGAFSNIDDTNLCSGASAVVVSCQLNGTGDRLQVTAANGPGDPLDSFTGTADFTIDGAATTGTTVDLTWDSADVDFTPSAWTDGSIAITSGPQSELSLTPDPLAFGTVDLGNMPVVDSFTLENVGAADANITGVSLAGPDAEFTIAADNCSGTLAAGASCTIDIQFDAAANGSYSNQLDITSDANVNPNPSAGITGSADSVASLSVDPPFGPVNLGIGVVGTTLTANGTVSNSGSADGNFSCTLTGDPQISTSPSPLAGSVPAGGSTDFSIACSIPADATEGDSYSATLECTGDNGFSGTHEISCGATEFVAFPIPTMSKWGLAILALLMVMVGGLSVRFFRT